ncbi:hypothetical protein T09_2548 [Trichinella sp. T9]|nr:hypothetical protein T09_2548 [Trichinella sp. T9]
MADSVPSSSSTNHWEPFVAGIKDVIVILLDCNKFMGRIDLSAMLMSAYEEDHKCRRWHRRVFYWIFVLSESGLIFNIIPNRLQNPTCYFSAHRWWRLRGGPILVAIANLYPGSLASISLQMFSQQICGGWRLCSVVANFFDDVSEKVVSCAFVADMPENVRQLLKTGSRMKDLNLARSSPVSEQLLPTGTPWIRRTPAWAQERQDQDRKQYLLNYDVVRVVGRITFPWIACPTISRYPDIGTRQTS